MGSATLKSSTNERGERSRTKILRVAVDHFGHRGLRSASVAAIARDAGLAQPSIYSHFPSKDALFAAAVDSELSAAIDAVTTAAPPFDPAQLVGHVLLLLTIEVSQRPLLAATFASRDDATYAVLADLPSYDRLRAHLETELRAGQATGDIRPDLDPTIVALGSLTVIIALAAVLTQTNRPPKPERAFAVTHTFRLALAPTLATHDN